MRTPNMGDAMTANEYMSLCTQVSTGLMRLWERRAEFDSATGGGYTGSAADHFGHVLEVAADDDAGLLAEWLRYVAKRITHAV